ncbi:glycosyltransferase family 4 protein [Halomonas daqiaonensis]|uniref:Glycosyltransferase involved in cell wall bisynthesis n=1 Tax=Halomonas daqiaonensis TaxID=650850 RepID=A0A1H7VRN3_9GAMM|nr:glycosyltransferase family 4 protein [Halomonas daqiaonensis]SEM11505.1 Glycosyltransferase involved in cell wall bisynthesis [Halomonas daqiaonensis]
MFLRVCEFLKSNFKYSARAKRVVGKLFDIYIFLLRFRYERKLKKIGHAAFFEEVEKKFRRRSDESKSKRISTISRRLNGSHLRDVRFELAQKSVGYHVSEDSLYALLLAAQECGDIDVAWSSLKRYERLVGDLWYSFRFRKLRASPVNLLSLRDLVGSSNASQQNANNKKICYVLNNSLPHSTLGYAIRSQCVAECLTEKGFQVVGVTRPGFPLDAGLGFNSEMDSPLVDHVNGVEYHRLLSPNKKEMRLVDYIPKASIALEEKFKELDPGLVVAASNFVCGLPALIACRNLGIPFIYEIRGFWELSRASREPAYSNSIEYKVQEAMEAFVAQQADHVFTLTQAMKDELVRREVDAEKITLLPNCCDPERFYHKPVNVQLKERLGMGGGSVVIGYIGTFSEYEGLDDIARACGMLHDRGLDFRLLLVGGENTLANRLGDISDQIKAIASEKGFVEKLIMPGRVPHDEVEGYYSIIDIAPFPRKPFPVCEMVSPMKTLEALSSEKAVVVSSVSALAEMVHDDETGLVFKKGNIEDLADKLEELVKNPSLRSRLGKNGREWVCRERAWESVGAIAKSVIDDTTKDVRVDGNVAER